MELFTLQNNDAFKGVVKLTGLTPVQIINAVSRALVSLEIMAGDQYYLYGKRLEELTDNFRGFTLEAFGKSNHALSREISNVVIMNPEEDCPYCGCTLEYEDDSAFGKVYTDVDCTNEYCTFQRSGYPHFDESYEDERT